jgi:hypothetical protein
MRVSDFAYEAIFDFETLKEISSNTRFLMEIECFQVTSLTYNNISQSKKNENVNVYNSIIGYH